MTDLARQLFGDDVPAKRRAVIVDLDETVCEQFDVPIRAGVELLRRLDRAAVEVHYVTARTEVSRTGTERFFAEYLLPFGRNVHYSPTVIGSRDHKLALHLRLAREYHVLASIGDSFEEAEASAAAGIPFVRVDTANAALAWVELEQLLHGHRCLMELLVE
jgi:phosphoglycolate phosphatase-like HAD superfamily hydrolase